MIVTCMGHRGIQTVGIPVLVSTSVHNRPTVASPRIGHALVVHESGRVGQVLQNTIRNRIIVTRVGCLGVLPEHQIVIFIARLIILTCLINKAGIESIIPLAGPIVVQRTVGHGYCGPIDIEYLSPFIPQNAIRHANIAVRRRHTQRNRGQSVPAPPASVARKGAVNDV